MVSTADLTHEEYKHKLGYKPSMKTVKAEPSSPFRYAETKADKEVDWNAKGAVTPVKNQQQVRG